jgi:hypothetical protein
MRGVRRKSIKDDVVFITKGYHLERFIGAKAIANQNPRFFVCSSSGLRVKHISNLVETDGRVNISGLGAGKVLSRSRVSRLRASIGGSWPDNEWMEGPTVYGDTFDRSDQSPLDTNSSIIQIVTASQYFKRAENA